MASGVIVPGFSEFVNFAKLNHIFWAIASNNSPECIDEFLKRYCKDVNVLCMARIWDRPEYMKPNVYMLNAISEKIGVSNEEILFIGDNPRDYECAVNFKCEFIGLTPTSAKRARMDKYKYKGINILNDYYELIKLLEEN